MKTLMISLLSGLAATLFACGGSEAKTPSPDAEMCVPGSKGCAEHGDEEHGKEGHAEHGKEGAKDDHDEEGHADHGDEGHEGEGGSEEGKEITLSAEAMAVSEIRVGKAERRIISGGGAFPAEIAFDPQGTAHVAPIGGGRFARVDVKLGDKVEVGTVLATLVSSDVADLEGQLAQARARLAGAEAELRRNAELVKEGVGAERGLVDARATVATLRAETAGIQKRLAVFGPQVAGQLELKAPIAGTIAAIHAVVGESASDEAAFTITDPSRIFVEAFVPELDIAKIAIDAPVIVRTHAFPDLALAGKVSSIAPSLDRATRSLSVRIKLDNLDERLRGHMFAMVELAGDGGRSIVVPADGVAIVEGQDVVFVPSHEERTFVPKPVKLGRRASGFVEVLAGLEEGAVVVVHGGFVLKSALSSGSISEGHEH
jgi:cobalt-zinc-cadmium efflux system membrane fusion protein